MNPNNELFISIFRTANSTALYLNIIGTASKQGREARTKLKMFSASLPSVVWQSTVLSFSSSWCTSDEMRWDGMMYKRGDLTQMRSDAPQIANTNETQRLPRFQRKPVLHSTQVIKIRNHSKRDDTTEPHNTEISMTLQPFTDVLSDVWDPLTSLPLLGLW